MGFPTAAVASILTALLCFSFSSACSCMERGDILERRDSSDVAFAGTLISQSVDSVRGTRDMKFAVTKVWIKGKKEQAEWMRVFSPMNTESCGVEFEKGAKLLVFARSYRDKRERRYSTNLCSGDIVAPSRPQMDSLWIKR